jgi:hypothetical protein
MRSHLIRHGLLALVLSAAGPVLAQQPVRPPAPADTGAAARDTAVARRDTAARAGPSAGAQRTASDACMDPMYVQLRQIPIERMDENQRRAYEELDKACTEARVNQARRRMGSILGIGRPDYANEVVPWLIGVAVFCTGVIMFAQTTR